MSEDSQSDDSQTQGYARKPVWIFIVSALFLLTPILHLMLTLRRLGEPHWYSPQAMLQWIPHIDSTPAFLSLLLFIAGFSILFVRRWAWWLGMLSLCAMSLYNIWIVKHHYASDPLILGLSSVGSLLLLAILFFSEFKNPYFNERLRWWESDPRFKVFVPVLVQEISQPVQLIDISKSGILLRDMRNENEESEFPDKITIEINNELMLPCSLARRADERSAAYKIIHITRYQSRYLRRWLDLLAKDPERKVRQ